ncbi:MAG: hypothetical protein FWH01_01370 [Oscillospiraceae bacterium]|nr:hypothetical protein [Oscillospiraceae bacterium]
MLKRCIAIIIACVALLPALAAHADLVAEPANSFFDRYGNDCVYLGRSFQVNSADGFVQIKDEPGSNRGGPEMSNGEIVYLNYSCLYKGEYWGQARTKNGWVKIDGQLLVLYDYVAFEEEHIADIYDYNGDYGEIVNSKAAVAWPWPGADEPLWTFEDLDTENLRVAHAYKDAQGREWGFVPYLYGSPNIWFCLSDPLNKDIPAFNPAPAPMAWVPDTAHNAIENSVPPTLMLIIILVAALVIGTLIILKVFWKPVKSKAEVN